MKSQPGICSLGSSFVICRFFLYLTLVNYWSIICFAFNSIYENQTDLRGFSENTVTLEDKTTQYHIQNMLDYMKMHFPSLPHLMVVNLSLQFLDVIGGDRTVLNDAMGLFNKPLEVLHFHFILFILQHCLLEREIFTCMNSQVRIYGEK